MPELVAHASRRALVALFVLLAGTAVLAARATSAHALLNARCVGTETLSYSPGLTNTPQPQTINVNVNLAPCVSVTDLLTIRSATSSAPPFTTTRSCTDLLGSAPIQRTVTWNTGERTVYTANQLVNYVSGEIVVVEQGTVISGKFLGGTVEANIVMLADLTKCSTPNGIRSLFGPFNLTILNGGP